MATTLAATRQPFGELNGARLQNLGSLKNRQNALPTALTTSVKRKAQTFEEDDAENIDPVIFLSASKRSRNPDGSGKDAVQKTANFFLTKAPPSPNDFSCLKPVVSQRRPILPARSPAHRINTTVSKATPLSAPAGRSPTRKRVGILNRRKTGSPYTSFAPPKISGGSGLGFSIDAALSGTIPSYKPRQPKAVPETLHEPEYKSSWEFDIYVDSAEEEATNLMEHSASTLDISSDEESAARMKDERGKENVPPLDDISQTRTQLSAVDAAESSMNTLKARIRARRQAEQGAIDIDRSPLGDLAAEDFYAEGCDGSSVYIIAPEEEEGEAECQASFDFNPAIDMKGKGKSIDIDELMRKDDFEVAPKAILLQPMEKAEDGFELWESNSAKGDE